MTSDMTSSGSVIAPLARPSNAWLRVLSHNSSDHNSMRRPWPAITTHNRGNHSVRTERWRYIRYADGSEELYDHDADPLEWKNLANDPSLAEVKAALAKHLPATNAPDAPRQKKK